MKLGFIGTGQITKAVIIGILNSKLRVSKSIFDESSHEIINSVTSTKRCRSLTII